MQARVVVGTATAAAFVAGALVAGGGWAVGESHQQAARPNVIVIETDDQTLAEMEVLPKTRALIGGEGVTFDNNFDSFSLCCPSRATLLTGQYSHNNGVRGNQPPDGGYYKLDSTNTLAVWLHNAGYYTAQVGKYLNGYGTRNPREIPPGWVDWHGSVDPSTYRYYGYTLNENGTLRTYCSTPQPSCYQTDVYRDKAIDIIREHAGAPLFLWIAFLANHSGGPQESDDPRGLGTPAPAPRYRDTFKNATLPEPPSFDEADVSDKPAVIRNRRRLTPADVSAIHENWQQRRETLLAVDDAVAALVEALRAQGQLDNTLILFTSDNGFFHGEHRVRSGKVLLYEPSIRVPLLMRWTGNRALPRGVHRKQLTMNIDYAETILGAAGDTVRPARVEDGVNLLRLWRDGSLELGRDLLVDNSPGDGHFDAIRTRRYLYAEYANGDRELYDLRSDAYELSSQHANPAFAAIRASLSARLHQLVSCSGGSCRAHPSARFTVRCLRRTMQLSIAGDEVMSVAFTASGRRLSSDAHPPFRVVSAKRRGPVRAEVVFRFDRLVSLDHRGCG
jgi:N-acetylglucosamine-6-sulfatase